MSSRRAHRPLLLEPLESRQLLSASVALLVLQLPDPPALPVQVDANDPPVSETNVDGLNSALDIRVRTVPGGLYLTVAASSTEVMTLAPTGTVDIYEGSNLLATVALGHSIQSTLTLPAGSHSFTANYSGDTHFLGSTTTQTVFIPNTAAPSTPFATNDTGERIRPTRLLSNVNYFDAHNLTVAAIPTPPSPTTPPDPTLPVVPPTPPASDPVPVPDDRFAKVSFNVKLPKLHRIH